MERLFVLKTLSRTQRATKVKKFVGFSLKPLRCRDPALPPLYGHAYSRPFFHAYFSCIYAHAYFSCIYAHDTPPRVQHFSAFHFLCFFYNPYMSLFNSKHLYSYRKLHCVYNSHAYYSIIAKHIHVPAPTISCNLPHDVCSFYIQFLVWEDSSFMS